MTPGEIFAVQRLGSRWAVISGGAIMAYAQCHDDAVRLASAAEKVLEQTETARRSEPERPARRRR